MKITVDENLFVQSFVDYNRGDNFSREGLEALFGYFEELECEGYEIELDVIAICCEYTEAAAEEVIQNYDLDPEMDFEAVVRYLEDRTTVIYSCEASDKVLYADF